MVADGLVGLLYTFGIPQALIVLNEAEPSIR